MRKGKELRTGSYWIIVIIVSLLLLWGAWSIWGYLSGRQQLLRAVPATSGLVAGWPQAASFLQSADTLLGKAGVFPASVERDLTLYRDLFQRMDSSEASMQRPLLFFLQMNGPEGPALGAIWDARDADAFTERLLQRSTPRQTRYRGTLITTAGLEGGEQLVFARYQNLLLLGRFPFLVEEVIGTLSGNTGQGALPVEMAAFSEAPLTLWVNEEMLNRSRPGQGDSWPQGWLRTGISVKDGYRVIDGRFFPAPNQFLPWMEGTAAARPGPVLNVIPEQVSYLEWRYYDQPEDGLGDGLTADFFKPLAGNEQVYAGNVPGGTAREEEFFWVLSLKDRAAATQALDSLARQVGTLEDYDYQTYRIRRLLTGALQPGAAGLSFESPYCVVLDDYLLLSNSRSGLELWVDQYLAGATLVRSEAFLEFYQNNDEPARVWWLARPALLDGFAAAAPLRDALLGLTAGRPFIGVRWSGELAAPKMEAVWEEEKRVKAAIPGSRIAWRARLAADARTALQVLQPGERASPFFVVQDEAYQLYLLDAAGRERWRKPLESPVLSSFHLIDYYQDGQRQLLFNTPTAIHLLDVETGERVGIFPLQLNSPATNGVTVVDTSGYGGYAFFVANSNGHLNGFDREGRPLPGWSPRLIGAQVDYPLLHFQEATRDFFVALDTAGTLHAFRRDGAYRFPPLAFNDTFPNPPDYQLHPRSGRIVACNQDGMVYVTNLIGEHFRLRLESRPRRPVQFAFADVTGDDRNDYLSLNGNRVSGHYYRGNNFERAFTFEADRPLSDLFAVGLPGRNKAAVGAVDAAAGKVYLIDGEGNLWPGFPLAGRTRFAVSETSAGGALLLVVADGRTVYGYELEGLENLE